MKKKKNFTLTELIIVLIAVGILATFAIPGYQNFVERSKAEVCRTNLEVLLGAVEVYSLTHDALPAELGHLQDEHVKRAWVEVLGRKGAWKTKLAYFITNLDRGRVVFAQEGYWSEVMLLACPKDDTPPPDGYSYGINQAVAGLSLVDYGDLDADTIIIADSDTELFVTPTKRHIDYKIAGSIEYAQAITKGGDFSFPGHSLGGPPGHTGDHPVFEEHPGQHQH